MFSFRRDFRLMCEFIISSETNYVDEDIGSLQNYKILEFIWFNLVFLLEKISEQFFLQNKSDR
jgi:hypothetical protein